MESRAIQASLALYQDTVGGCEIENVDAVVRSGPERQEDPCNVPEESAEQLRLALRLSEQQQLEEEQRRLLEEETFQQVLELSLTDK